MLSQLAGLVTGRDWSALFPAGVPFSKGAFFRRFLELSRVVVAGLLSAASGEAELSLVAVDIVRSRCGYVFGDGDYGSGKHKG